MNKRKDSDHLWMKFILLFLILTMSLFMGFRLRTDGPLLFSRFFTGKAPNQPVVEANVDWMKLERIKRFIENQYNGPIVDSKLLEGALKGMVGTLENAGGEYFNAVQFNDILNRNQMTHGAGISLGVKSGKIIVIATESGSQGELAGVLSGDVIFKINDMVTTGTEIETARNVLRSKENRTVQLNIMRDEKHIEVNVKLRKLDKKTILTQLEDRMGVIHLPGFYLDMDSEFSVIVDDLVRQGALGIVLDLRNTPTGQLTESVNIAGSFIPKGQKIVSLRDTQGKIRDFMSNSGKYSHLPLVVLINGQTEGTAEIVAGVLGEEESVVVIGEKSLGEGRIFSYISRPEGEGIKLATGSYLLPSGAEIQENGIEPDLVVLGDRSNSSSLVKPEDAQMMKALEVLAKQIGP